VLALPGLGREPLLEGRQRGMDPQLQDRVDPPPELLLQLLQGVAVPGIEHERLLADGVGPDAEGEADVGVVQVVRGADAHVVDPVGRIAAAELLDVPVEALELGEKAHVKRELVQQAHGIVGVEGHAEAVARVADGPQVARGNVASDSRDGEVLGQGPVLLKQYAVGSTQYAVGGRQWAADRASV